MPADHMRGVVKGNTKRICDVKELDPAEAFHRDSQAGRVGGPVPLLVDVTVGHPARGGPVDHEFHTPNKTTTEHRHGNTDQLFKLLILMCPM